MHDFDAERKKRHEEREREFGERPFTFGGEVFYVKANVGYIGIKRIAELTEDTDSGQTFEAVEESVLSMIDPRDNARDRFYAVRNKDEDPITFEDLIELQSWLLTETSGRPPTQPESSVDSPGSTGTISTDSSSTGQEGASPS